MADCCNDKNRISIDQFFNNFNSEKRNEKLLKHLDECFLCRNYYIEREKQTELSKTANGGVIKTKNFTNLLFTQKSSIIKLLPVIILFAIAISLIPKLKSFNQSTSDTNRQTLKQPVSDSETK